MGFEPTTSTLARLPVGRCFLNSIKQLPFPVCLGARLMHRLAGCLFGPLGDRGLLPVAPAQIHTLVIGAALTALRVVVLHRLSGRLRLAICIEAGL